MYMQKKGAFQSMGPKEGVSVALREIRLLFTGQECALAAHSVRK